MVCPRSLFLRCLLQNTESLGTGHVGNYFGIRWLKAGKPMIELIRVGALKYLAIQFVKHWKQVWVDVFLFTRAYK